MTVFFAIAGGSASCVLIALGQMNTPTPNLHTATSVKTKRHRRPKTAAKQDLIEAEKALKSAQIARDKALANLEVKTQAEMVERADRLVPKIIRQMDVSTREAVMAMIIGAATSEQLSPLHALVASLN